MRPINKDDSGGALSAAFKRAHEQAFAAFQEDMEANRQKTRTERFEVLTRYLLTEVMELVCAAMKEPMWERVFVGWLGVNLFDALGAALEDPTSGSTWPRPRVLIHYPVSMRRDEAGAWRWVSSKPHPEEMDLEPGGQLVGKLLAIFNEVSLIVGFLALTRSVAWQKRGKRWTLVVPPELGGMLDGMEPADREEFVDRITAPYRIGWPAYDVQPDDIAAGLKGVARVLRQGRSAADPSLAVEWSADLRRYLWEVERRAAFEDSTRLRLTLPPGMPGSFSLCIDVDPLVIDAKKKAGYFEMRLSIDFEDPDVAASWSEAERSRVLAVARAPFERLARGQPFFGELYDDAETQRHIVQRLNEAVAFVADADAPDRAMPHAYLVHLLGVTVRSVRNYLSGETMIPPEKLWRLAARTGRPIDFFFPPTAKCMECAQWVPTERAAAHCATDWNRRHVGRLVVAGSHTLVEDVDGNPHKVFDGRRLAMVRDNLREMVTPLTEILEIEGDELRPASRETLERLGIEPPSHEILADAG